jgi:hypothetical protein
MRELECANDCKGGVERNIVTIINDFLYLPEEMDFLTREFKESLKVSSPLSVIVEIVLAHLLSSHTITWIRYDHNISRLRGYNTFVVTVGVSYDVLHVRSWHKRSPREPEKLEGAEVKEDAGS